MWSRRRKLLLAGAAVLLVAVLPAVGAAQPGDDPAKHPRMSGELVGMESASLGRTTDGVKVEVTAVSWAAADAADAIEAAGGTVEATYGEYAAGTLPIANLDVLGDNTEVRWVQRPAIPYPEETTGQGPEVIGANIWQDKGFTGRGQVVAIIDSGFKDLDISQASDDIPEYGDIGDIGAQVMTKTDLCAGDGFNTNTAHGTAVAEIVHETAPDADLLLICIDDGTGFGAALNFAEANGARVVSVSLGFFNTGRGDGTGSLREWANKARNKGILWVNSTGNYAQTHWHGNVPAIADGQYLPTVWSFDITSDAKLYLKWDDWPASDCDLDFRVCSTANCTGPGDPVALSDDRQDGSQPPTEEITVSGSGTLYARIFKYSCSETPRIDLFVPSGPSWISPSTSASSVTGLVPHNLIHSVGAVHWAYPNNVEPYSSRGPTIDGRQVPDTSAPDGVANGQYPGGFFGTSAAAPHVAGSAALILQAYPDLSVAELDIELKATTWDRSVDGLDDDPYAYGEGPILFGTPPNLGSCFGRNPTLTGSIGPDYLVGTAGSDVILARDGDDVVVGLEGNDRICGGTGNDVLFGDQDNDIMSGGAGRDWIWGGPNHDQMYGDGANDQMRGGSGRDRMWGGLGSDKIVGNTGNDTLYGEGGDDLLYGSRGSDILVGNKGTDTGWGAQNVDTCNVEIAIDCE